MRELERIRREERKAEKKEMMQEVRSTRLQAMRDNKRAVAGAALIGGVTGFVMGFSLEIPGVAPTTMGLVLGAIGAVAALVVLAVILGAMANRQDKIFNAPYSDSDEEELESELGDKRFGDKRFGSGRRGLTVDTSTPAARRRLSSQSSKMSTLVVNKMMGLVNEDGSKTPAATAEVGAVPP